jgi:hypothetical protein
MNVSTPGPQRSPRDVPGRNRMESSGGVEYRMEAGRPEFKADERAA